MQYKTTGPTSPDLATPVRMYHQRLQLLHDRRAGARRIAGEHRDTQVDETSDAIVRAKRKDIRAKWVKADTTQT